VYVSDVYNTYKRTNCVFFFRFLRSKMPLHRSYTLFFLRVCSTDLVRVFRSHIPDYRRFISLIFFWKLKFVENQSVRFLHLILATGPSKTVIFVQKNSRFSSDTLCRRLKNELDRRHKFGSNLTTTTSRIMGGWGGIHKTRPVNSRGR